MVDASWRGDRQVVRIPVGVGLLLAMLVSLALWAGLFVAVFR